MPTARPIITASVTAVWEMDSAAARPRRPSIVMTIPAIAVSRGRPAASREPSATASTMNAMISPMSSLLPVLLDFAL